MTAPLHEGDLAAYLAPGTLVVLDFDGTLARLVPERDAARLTPRTRDLLRRVARRHPVAVLSGRALADIRPRLQGVSVARVVGSHGVEWDGPDRRRAGWRRLVADWVRRLTPVLRTLPGVELEGKEVSLAIHYARAADPRHAARFVRAAASGLQGAVAVEGKRVLNLLPAGAGDKGDALRRLARELRAERLVFIGDDETDELAFRASLPVPALMVRVGPARRTAAAVLLHGRRDVDRLLARIARSRLPSRLEDRTA